MGRLALRTKTITVVGLFASGLGLCLCGCHREAEEPPAPGSPPTVTRAPGSVSALPPKMPAAARPPASMQLGGK